MPSREPLFGENRVPRPIIAQPLSRSAHRCWPHARCSAGAQVERPVAARRIAPHSRRQLLGIGDDCIRPRTGPRPVSASATYKRGSTRPAAVLRSLPSKNRDLPLANADSSLSRSFEIEGVPARVLREFSRRRVEIEERARELRRPADYPGPLDRRAVRSLTARVRTRARATCTPASFGGGRRSVWTSTADQIPGPIPRCGGRTNYSRHGSTATRSGYGPAGPAVCSRCVHQSRSTIWIAAAVGMASRAPRIPSNDAPTSTATIVTIGFTHRAFPYTSGCTT